MVVCLRGESTVFGYSVFVVVCYSIVWKKNQNYGKVSKTIHQKQIKNPGKSPKNGRAPRAKRAAHAHFGDFCFFLVIFFSIQYCTGGPGAKCPVPKACT